MSQIQHKLVKNANWWEADQLAIYKRGQGIEARDFRVTNPVGGRGGNYLLLDGSSKVMLSKNERS